MGGICLWKQGGPTSSPNTSKRPVSACFYGREGLLTPWTRFGKVRGGGSEVGRPRVVASAGGLQFVRSKLEAWLCPSYKDHTLFFFFLRLFDVDHFKSLY